MSLPQPAREFESANGPPDFDHRTDMDGPGIAHVSVGGELDLATAPKLEAAFAEVPSSTTVVILDLRELTFMDSTGLHLIMAANKRLAAAGCRLVVISGGHQIQRTFEITGVKQHLEFVIATNGRDSAPSALPQSERRSCNAQARSAR